MKFGADTSIILRVLTGQPEPLAASVRARLETLWLDGVVLGVCDLVVAETYFALQHSYGISKESALRALKQLSVHPGFRLSEHVADALKVPHLESAKPSFIDRVIHGTYVDDEDSVMLTCEKSAKRLSNVEVVKVSSKGGDSL